MPKYRLLLILSLCCLQLLAALADKKPTPGERQYQLGRESAIRATGQHRYGIQVFEMGDANIDIPTQEILKQHNITAFGRGCVRWPGEADFYRGYNEVSKQVIEKEYGASIWETLESEARAALKDWPKERATPTFDLIARWAKGTTADEAK